MKKDMVRVAAQEQGLKTYVPEKPCARGHQLRKTSDGNCVECKRLGDRRRYHADPIKTREKVKKKYDNNAEKIRAKRREAYAKNPEPEKETARVRSAEWRLKNPAHTGAKESKKRYKVKNPGKIQADTAKRRVAKLNRTVGWANKKQIQAYYDVCAFFNEVNGYIKYHVDHEIPLQGNLVSGLHVHNNLRVIPWEDNVKKANRYTPV